MKNCFPCDRGRWNFVRAGTSAIRHRLERRIDRDGQQKRFTSYNRGARTGLDYAVNRTYDSKQGRFTQVDPIGMGSVSLTLPQTLNLYAYCANDPINHTDPSGLGFFSFLKKLFKWILAVIAVIVAILTIIAAPPTLVGILGAISASAAAGSAVAGAFGLTTVSKILGWIAIGTGIGAGIAGLFAAKPDISLIIKNFVSTAETTLPLWQQIASAVSNASAISNAFASKPKKKPRKRPGLFQTVDQVAIWWLKIANPHSIAINREIAVPICERTSDGALILGPYDIGTNASSQVKDCAAGTKMVGSAHAHAAYDPNFDNENFSTDPGDRVNANNRSLAAGGSVPNYVGTPSGTIRKFKPSAIAGTPKGKVITFKSKTSTVVP
ncbi:MAG: RHS repeat-associated core domain-containing protein [Pyrinomonadaceae bacterium]